MTALAPRRHPLARAVRPLADRAAPDADFVSRFVRDRDDGAFAELVRRHGPAVLAACRHAARHTHDADDAFQATFLVLARKAHALDPARPLAAWLRGVAVRAGRKAGTRRRWASLAEVPARASGSDAEAVAEVRAAVASLPPHQRAAVERCELGGEPRAAAAAALGVAPGTLSSRLALARRALADRLRRRGYGPPACVVPPALLLAARATASEVSTPAVRTLAEATMRSAWHGWALAVGTAAVTLGVGLAAEPAPAPRPAEPPPRADAGRLMLAAHAAEPSWLWVDADGGRPVRLAESDLRAAGADLRELFSLGIDLMPRRTTQFQTAGAVRPNGEVPVPTRKGVILVTPTAPPTLRPLAPGRAVDDAVAAWSPDGRTCVLRDDDTGKHRLLDTITGEQTPLNVPDRHHVQGWLPAGDRLLTAYDDRPWVARVLGEGHVGGPLHRLDADGTATPVANRAGVSSRQPSPDGTRLLYWCPADRGGRQGFAVGVTGLDSPALAPPISVHDDASCLGTAWSPDGQRVAYVETRLAADGMSNESHLWLCDADGTNRREVPLPAGPWLYGLLAWR